MVRYTIKKTLLAEVNVQRLDIVFRTGISRCLIDMSLHICRNSIHAIGHNTLWGAMVYSFPIGVFTPLL